MEQTFQTEDATREYEFDDLMQHALKLDEPALANGAKRHI